MFKILTLALAVAVCNAKYLPLPSEVEPVAVMPNIATIFSLPVEALPAPVPEVLSAAEDSIAAYRPAPAEPSYPPTPYSFGYETVDSYGTKQARTESGDGSGSVKGSYSYTNAQGLSRTVEYVADAYGFRATVTSNEPGVQRSNPADVVLNGPEVAYAEEKSSAPAAAAPLPPSPSRY